MIEQALMNLRIKRQIYDAGARAMAFASDFCGNIKGLCHYYFVRNNPKQCVGVILVNLDPQSLNKCMR